MLLFERDKTKTKIYKVRSVYVKQKGKERKDGTEMIGPRDGEPFIIVP